MKRTIHLSMEFEEDEYDALQDEADFRFLKTVEKFLESMILDQLDCCMGHHETNLSEEELREFRNDYGDEDWLDETDDDIPF
ncbi:hypothetical protein HQ496_08305 [bacterium]|nr:hypothetical protein [bacterium]